MGASGLTRSESGKREPRGLRSLHPPRVCMYISLVNQVVRRFERGLVYILYHYIFRVDVREAGVDASSTTSISCAARSLIAFELARRGLGSALIMEMPDLFSAKHKVN